MRTRQLNHNKNINKLLLAWFCGGILICLPNNGGSGLALPQNLLAWSLMACLYIISSAHNPGLSGTLSWRKYIGGMFFGLLLWLLPLLWTKELSWFVNALPRALGAIGFFLLLYKLRSYEITEKARLQIITIVILSALIQSGYATIQLLSDAKIQGGRPYGSFQQVNVLASFLATGISCATLVYTRKEFFLQGGNLYHSIYWKILSGIAIIMLPAVIILLQSRAGYIGASISVIVILTAQGLNGQKCAVFQASLLIFCGILLGVIWLQYGHKLLPGLALPIISKEGSTSSRIHMLSVTWKMILSHPFLGNGYGGFEAVYGHFAMRIPPGIEGDTVTHPHNELLFAWAEGGIIAAGGLIIMIVSAVRFIFLPTAMATCGVALVVPLLVHMNLEYPLYQSASHGLLMIILLCVAGPLHTNAIVKFKKPSIRKFIPVVINITTGMCVLSFMVTALITQHRITLVERHNLTELAFNEDNVMKELINPISQNTRLSFDRHVSLLLRFNTTRNPDVLTEFYTWGNDYLKTHNDPNVYDSLIRIANAMNSPESKRLCEEAHGRWQSDIRFNCN